MTPDAYCKYINQRDSPTEVKNQLGINLRDKYLLIFHRNRVAIGKFSASNPLDVDHYHYISADNPWGSDTSGVAKQMGYYGWKYDGTVCWLDKKERTAITEFWGNPNDWEGGKLNAGLVITTIANNPLIKYMLYSY